MKKRSGAVVVLMLAVSIFCRHPAFGESRIPEGAFKETVLVTSWEIQKSFPGEGDRDLVSPAPTEGGNFHVYVGNIPETKKRVSFGAILNFKYFGGLSYDYFRENLPGRKLSVKINVPEESVSSFGPIPNRLRITLKAEKDGVWTEYFEDKEWISVRKAGTYEFSVQIPDRPVRNRHGRMFDPGDIVLLSVDYFLMEGSKRHSYISYTITDLSIEGIDVDPGKIKWQASENGHSVEGKYLKYSPEGSFFSRSMGASARLSSAVHDVLAPAGEVTSAYDGMFVTLTCLIPEELRHSEGEVSLKVIDNSKEIQATSTKRLTDANALGEVFLTVPMDTFGDDKNVDIGKAAEGLELALSINTKKPHTARMMPVIIEPVKIKYGRLVSFDERWEVRDVQGKGGYPFMTIDPAGTLDAESGITVRSLGPGQYQMDVTARLSGGINWEDPFYRVELIREFDGITDLSDHELEMTVSPLTDTAEFWQTPYRARIGLMDAGGRVMMGPNISLSEGLPAAAKLEVSDVNPMPKGLAMPGFDIRKAKAMLINLEGPHEVVPEREIRVSFADLFLRYVPTDAPPEVRHIDFSRQKRDPAEWELTKMIKDSGGYILGINYPFPALDVPETVMKVPLVYPSVGMKPTDAMHLGLSSNITKKTMIRDFTVFAEHDLTIVRIFAFGHLSGVFEWDEKGEDIYFGNISPDTLKRVSEMRVEDLAEYLNANEDTFFTEESPGKFAGLERHVISDLRAILDAHETVEMETGKRLVSMLCLYDFKIGEGVEREGPYHEFAVGEHPEVVTRPEIKVKAHALMWKTLKELSKDPRFYRYMAVVDVMNEPGNATALAAKQHFSSLVDFVGESIYLARDAVGPGVPVSVGSRSWPLDLIFWRPIAEGMDVLKPHYWESLESYNIDVPGIWPLDMPSEKLWHYLGTDRDGRPTGIGEINTGAGCKEKLLRMEKAGYDFALLWSYSGHDGHDSKPLMKDLEEYQKGNRLFATLSRFSPEEIEQAFSFLFSGYDDLEKSFPPAGSGRAKPARSFIDEISASIDEVRDPDVKLVIETIIRTAVYKGMELDRENMEFLRNRALGISEKRVHNSNRGIYSEQR